MIAYGKSKRMAKLHPHNECEVCSEKKIIKKTQRQQNKKLVKNELMNGIK